MYLLTGSENKEIIAFGEELDYMPNGYPRLVKENVAFVKEFVNVYEVPEIPENVEPGRYCYDEETGFYKNTDYREPEPTIEEQVATLKETQLEQDELIAQLLYGGDE